MTKPRLVKVRALLYVLHHIKKRGCAYFDTAPRTFFRDYKYRNLNLLYSERINIIKKFIRIYRT